MVVSTQELLRDFNPGEHITKIKTSQGPKDYLPVQWRIVWFRALCPEGTIDTQLVHLDLTTEFTEPVYEKGSWVKKTEPGVVVFRAVVSDGKGASATGTKMEKKAFFPDFVEKGETGAIGRALAALGYGTQFTDEEWNEGERIADSPVDRAGNKEQEQKGDTQKKPQPMGEYPASGQQRKSILKLCEELNKPSPLTPQTTFEQAKILIQQLTTEHKEARQKQSQPTPPPANNQLQIDAAFLRARIDHLKPTAPGGVPLTLEDMYSSIVHREYPGDNALKPGECVRMNRQLDEIERLRQPAAQATA